MHKGYTKENADIHSSLLLDCIYRVSICLLLVPPGFLYHRGLYFLEEPTKINPSFLNLFLFVCWAKKQEQLMQKKFFQKCWRINRSWRINRRRCRQGFSFYPKNNTNFQHLLPQSAILGKPQLRSVAILCYLSCWTMRMFIPKGFKVQKSPLYLLSIDVPLPQKLLSPYQ